MLSTSTSADIVAVEGTLKRVITGQEKTFLTELANANILDTKYFLLPEQPIKEADTIMASNDIESIVIVPEKDNPYKMPSQFIWRSRLLGREVVLDYTYEPIMRDNVMVGWNAVRVVETVRNISGAIGPAQVGKKI